MEEAHERKERKRKERKERRESKKRDKRERASQVQKDKEPITEAPVTKDVEEDSEPLILRRRKGKAIILDSESTETTEAHKDQHASIPILSML